MLANDIFDAIPFAAFQFSPLRQHQENAFAIYVPQPGKGSQIEIRSQQVHFHALHGFIDGRNDTAAYGGGPDVHIQKMRTIPIRYWHAAFGVKYDSFEIISSYRLECLINEMSDRGRIKRFKLADAT